MQPIRGRRSGRFSGMGERVDKTQDETGGLGRVAFRARADVFVRRHFPGLQYAVDALAWAAAILATALLRYDLRIGPVNEWGVAIAIAIAIAYQAAVGLGL